MLCRCSGWQGWKPGPRVAFGRGMPAWVRVSATFTGLGANESLGVPAPMAPVAWGVCCVPFFLRALIVGAIEDRLRFAVEHWVVLTALLTARC